MPGVFVINPVPVTVTFVGLMPLVGFTDRLVATVKLVTCTLLNESVAVITSTP